MPLRPEPAPTEAISIMGQSPSLASSSLSDLLGGIIDTGVVLQADLTLSVANVDLVYLGLRAVICAADADPARAALGHLPDDG